VLKDIVGIEFVDHTTPRSVTVALPSDVILPPERAVVDLIESTAVVVSVGTVEAAAVDNDTSLPYAMPLQFDA
jgi:hypothetical protein